MVKMCISLIRVGTANSTEILKSLLEQCNFFNKNDVTIVAMVTMTFQYGRFFSFSLI